MKTSLVLVFLSFSITATADITADLRKCSQMEDKNLRLGCFDQLTKSLPVASQAKPVFKEKSSLPIMKAPKSLPSETINMSKEDAFGRTNEQLVNLDKLNSQIDGKFKGWQKGAIIPLKNGQRWKVKSRSRGYVNLTDPDVSIVKGVFGYTMSVKGLNANAKVQRVD